MNMKKIQDGLIYFNSLDDILNYEASSEHNFCLIPLQNYENFTGKIKTLLCHDMQGGYLCYDRLSGAPLTDEQTLYTFFHWWYIDVFVYFSHNFITVPPVVWTNQAHRHGVVVLGTLITEDDGGAALCCEIFSSTTKADQLIVKLVDLCVVFGFDGWLINIENSIEDSHLSAMQTFLVKLRECLKNRIGEHAYIVWYDSVTTSGKLKWQNELNENNLKWFEAVDAIYLNYTWKPDNLKISANNAKSKRFEVFASIDVFGRGQIGDGGWNCVEALKHVRDAELSAAIFAPGWISEKFPDACIFTNSFRFWDSLRGLVPANRCICSPFTTDFHHGLNLECEWFCMANAQLQPFYLGDGIEDNKNTSIEKDAHAALCADVNGLKLEGDTEQTLFLCNIKTKSRFLIVVKSDAATSIDVYLANGSVISLRTSLDENGGETKREIPLESSSTELDSSENTEFCIKRIAARCEGAECPAHILHFSISKL